MTNAVCDSGPLTHLWQIDQWPLFRVFEALHIAEQVAHEVHEHVELDQMNILASGTLHVHSIEERKIDSIHKQLPAGTNLQIADMATLVLAQELAPDLVLTDDLALRQAVETQGHTPMGTVGIILRAYKRGLFDGNSLDNAIDKLFVQSNLYLNPRFKSYVRRLIAEMTGQDSTT